MGEILRVTDETLDEHFIGIEIPVSDIGGSYIVPGWRCIHCGWSIGSQGLPPSHHCPEDGVAYFLRITEALNKRVSRLEDRLSSPNKVTRVCRNCGGSNIREIPTIRQHRVGDECLDCGHKTIVDYHE